MRTEIAVVAAIVAAACSLPGVFLVLRRMSLMSDAISHSVLFGIVIGFFAIKTFHSPLLMAGAVATGVLTVFLSETLLRTRLLKEDAAIGLVFPALFSIGVILISRYAGNVHLDTDAVLTGEIALAPFDRFTVKGLDLGPVSAWVMGGIGLLNALFLVLFYKELEQSFLAHSIHFVSTAVLFVSQSAEEDIRLLQTLGQGHSHLLDPSIVCRCTSYKIENFNTL